MKWRERLFWIALAVIIFLFLRSCGQGCGIFKRTSNNTDTISVKIDTVFVKVKADTQYVPEIIGVTNTIHVTKYLHDTLTEFEVRIDPTDTAAILQRFYQKVFYSDTQNVKTYGSIIIQDSVTQNRITSRRLQTNLSIPEVTKTITLRDRRTIGYIGFSAMGDPDNIIYALGADFSLKLKNDKIFSIGANYTRNDVLYYEAAFKLPIRLKRK